MYMSSVKVTHHVLHTPLPLAAHFPNGPMVKRSNAHVSLRDVTKCIRWYNIPHKSIRLDIRSQQLQGKCSEIGHTNNHGAFHKDTTLSTTQRIKMYSH